MSALLALALAAAPGCPAALDAAATLPDDALAARAPALARALEDAGAGPTAALAAAARALADAGAGSAQEAAAAAFRGALATHCTLAAAPAAAAASPADRAALAEVLARPELSQVRLDPWAIRRALVRVWDWLVELLGTQEAERYASLGRALFLGTAAAALTLVLAALRRRRASRRGRARPGDAGPALEAAPAADAEGAEEALRRGESRNAVRLALLAALAALERTGQVPRGRALTNEEIVHLATGADEPLRLRLRLGPRPRLRSNADQDQNQVQDQDQDQDQDEVALARARRADDLVFLARAFDRAVYGGLPVSAEEARSAVERSRRVVAAAGGTP